MKKGLKSIFIRIMIIALALFCCSCGDDDNGGFLNDSEDNTAPAVVSVMPDDNVLGKDEAVVVRFSETMDMASLALGGDLAAESNTAVWSQTTEANDTVTIQPQDRWTSSQDRSFTLDATDVAGNPLSRLSLSFLVPMEYDNFQAVEVVIGQPDFITTGSSVDEYSIASPYGNVAVAEGRLYIGDHAYNRVIVFNNIPQTNGAAADFVLGQPDFTTSVGETSQSGMDGPQQISVEGETMIITEYTNARVLVYNSIPEDGSALPDVVVGQSDFDTVDNTCDAIHMAGMTETATIAGGRLIATDTEHNRVLIWNSIPTANGQPADLVLGQNSFDTCAYNDDNQDGSADSDTSARVMNNPSGVWSDGASLIVSDSDNNRVLIWNTFPTANFQPADIVLGQVDFTTNTANDSDGDGVEDATPNAKTMSYPYDGVWSNGEQVFITDGANNRVLIWNNWPTSNFTPADVVLGQSDFTKFTENDSDQDGTADGQPSETVFYYPTGVYGFNNLLFVSDNDNNRVLIFRSN